VRADAASERRMTAMALPAMEIADGAQQVLLDKVLLSDNTPFGQTRNDEDSLNDDSIKAEAAEILRPLIDWVVLTPAADARDGIEAQVYGDPEKQKLPAEGSVGSQLSVVAGARNHLDLLLSARWENGTRT
jgi:hypothetical protein